MPRPPHRGRLNFFSTLKSLRVAHIHLPRPSTQQVPSEEGGAQGLERTLAAQSHPAGSGVGGRNQTGFSKSESVTLNHYNTLPTTAHAHAMEILLEAGSWETAWVRTATADHDGPLACLDGRKGDSMGASWFQGLVGVHQHCLWLISHSNVSIIPFSSGGSHLRSL